MIFVPRTNVTRSFHTHARAGTPCWMAPEVMRQEEGYSDRADVWSLGICVLELAKSYPPYAKERAMKVLLRTIRDPAPTFDTYKVGWFVGVLLACFCLLAFFYFAGAADALVWWLP